MRSLGLTGAECDGGTRPSRQIPTSFHLLVGRLAGHGLAITSRGSVLHRTQTEKLAALLRLPHYLRLYAVPFSARNARKSARDRCFLGDLNYLGLIGGAQMIQTINMLLLELPIPYCRVSLRRERRKIPY